MFSIQTTGVVQAVCTEMQQTAETGALVVVQAQEQFQLQVAENQQLVVQVIDEVGRQKVVDQLRATEIAELEKKREAAKVLFEQKKQLLEERQRTAQARITAAIEAKTRAAQQASLTVQQQVASECQKRQERWNQTLLGEEGLCKEGLYHVASYVGSTVDIGRLQMGVHGGPQGDRPELGPAYTPHGEAKYGVECMQRCIDGYHEAKRYFPPL